jgi:transcriptional regulator with XRE-family HTH domain
MEKVAMLLRVIRAQHEPKISQSQVAAIAEGFLPSGRTMSAARYWQIENGEGSEPSDDERLAVARALGVTTDDIAWPTPLKVKAF